MADTSEGVHVSVSRVLHYEYDDFFFAPEGVASIEVDPQRLKFLPGGQENVTEHVVVDIYLPDGSRAQPRTTATIVHSKESNAADA